MNKSYLLPFLLACVAPGCSEGSDGRPNEAESRSNTASIINGTDSTAEQDAVVLIADYNPSTQKSGRCTGTLLAPNLVLTARHCVAVRTDGADPCASNAVSGSQDPSIFYIFTGAKLPGDPSNADVRAKAAARGKKVITEEGNTLQCGHDLALLLLDKDIPNAKILPVRLDMPTLPGNVMTAVGWGMTAAGTVPSTRQQKKGLNVYQTGPAEGSDVHPALAEGEFVIIGEAACVGDSGGPVITSLRGVAGVVSLVGGGPGENPPDYCSGSKAGAIYTKTDFHKDLILSAYAEAGHEPWIEGEPAPGTKPPSLDGGGGGGGGGGGDKDGGTGDPGAQDGGSSKSGCAISPGVSSFGGTGLFALIGLAAFARRRRRAHD
ncbi:S1 family peptidase [Pendulispora rubella]|uniref:S1 family peptidase n=1 Tax=Pendulispora rubella TaxID=2741070 RepID=A0ABZ2KTT9_9BACT